MNSVLIRNAAIFSLDSADRFIERNRDLYEFARRMAKIFP